MKILVWLAEGTWQAGVDAARSGPADAEIILLHVVDPALAAGVDAARAGLLGRGRPPAGHGEMITAIDDAERALLHAAQTRLGRPARPLLLRGRADREVTAAAADAELLIVVRDGDHRHLGPHSFAPPTRFVVDHAPCPVLIVWPDPPATPDTLVTRRSF
ncbi:universal stress protein [Krasilnikovia sp. MM14-A1259]|uniref:universal stress protein n=1 Tax=Krasilnikovia sp. MM14-A1259 TaxID=3373539 RepID=UPI0038187B77